MGVAIGCQDVFITDAIPMAGDTVAPLQSKDQMQFFQIVFYDTGIVKFMAQKPGTDRK